MRLLWQAILIPLSYRQIVLEPSAKAIDLFRNSAAASRPDLLAEISHFCVDPRAIVKATRRFLRVPDDDLDMLRLLETIPRICSASVLWSSKDCSSKRPSTRSRPAILQLVLVGPETESETAPIPAFDNYFDLSFVTRLEIIAAHCTPWPAYLGHSSLPALVDLRLSGLYESDEEPVRTILQAVGRNLRRLHLFCGVDMRLFIVSQPLALSDLCPALADLGCDELTCQAFSRATSQQTGRRINTLLLEEPRRITFERIQARDSLLAWLGSETMASDWFNFIVHIRPRVVTLVGAGHDASLWADSDVRAARKVACLLRREVCDIILEDGLGHVIEPLEDSCALLPVSAGSPRSYPDD
jgi:hypothetical protein